MLIFAVDNEPTMLMDSGRAIRKAAPEAKLMCFERAANALDAIRSRGLYPEIVFSAIEMPGISGLEFAVELRKASPDTRIVFVTNFSHYALDAFQVRAQGYLIKPLTPKQVRKELDALPSAPVSPDAPASASQPDKLQVQCFGCFEVFWKGEPLIFARRQTKELFAYLVNRRGATCTTEEVISALWGDVSDLKNAKHRIRNYIADLRKTLKGIGMEDVLIRRRQNIAIRTKLLDCDYYRLLDSDVESIKAYRDDFMPKYSWAETTTGMLYFRSKS